MVKKEKKKRNDGDATLPSDSRKIETCPSVRLLCGVANLAVKKSRETRGKRIVHGGMTDADKRDTKNVAKENLNPTNNT